MVLVQHLLRLDQVLFHTAFDAPWNRKQPIQIVAHHGGFRTHRAHGFELFELGFRLFAGFFAELGREDTLFQLGQLVLAFLAVAQFLLNGLHLLIQIVFALSLFHLGFHPRFDLFLDLQDRHFALHMAKDLLKPLGHVQSFQDVLFQRDIRAQMPCDQISQTGRFGRVSHGLQRLFGDVLFDLGIAFEFIRHRPQHCLGRGFIAGNFGQARHTRLKERGVVDKFGDLNTALAFDQHLHRAIGQFQQLQHIGQNAHAVDAINRRIIDRRVNLAGQQDLLVIGHDLFQGADRFFAAHKQGHNHMGKHHNVAQRQHGVTG